MTASTPATATPHSTAAVALSHPVSRGATVVAVATTVVIAAGAFMLSFAALRDLAAKAGQPPSLAWIWPVIVDGSILQATVAVVAFASRRATPGARRFFWSVLAASALVSIAGNALHAAVSTTRVLDTTIAAGVATIAPISLLTATHGLALFVRPPCRDTVPSAATTAGGARDSAEGARNADASRDSDEGVPTLSRATIEAVIASAEAAADAEGTTAATTRDDARVGAIDTSATTDSQGVSQHDRDELIHELAAEGHSLRSIATQLANVGIKVHPSTVGRVLERASGGPEDAAVRRLRVVSGDPESE